MPLTSSVIFERYIARSRFRFFLSVFVPLTLLYAATASWHLGDFDVLTNAVSAWHLGNTGSPLLPGYEHLAQAPYEGFMGSFMGAPGGTVSKYPPGAAMLAAPLYALTPGELVLADISNAARPEIRTAIPLPPAWPSTLVAVLTTAAAMGILGLTFLMQGSAHQAWFAAWIAALGTSAWSVASDALLMHGPAMLWIALGVYLSSRQSYRGAGLAFGAAVLTRPHTAVIPAALGLGMGASQRSLHPVLRIGLASSLGVLILVLYNGLTFGQWSILGGYGRVFANKLVAPEALGFLRNLFGGLFDPAQGFLVQSPFLLLLVPGLLPAWRKTDPWVRGAAIGGLVYLLLQFKMNRYNPANATLYRYPLEALIASAPLWFAAYLYWLRGLWGRPHWRLMFKLTVLMAVGLQGIAIWLL
jgi:hypothetical protein